LGIEIEGCHFPGHFLARILIQEKEMFVDCFNHGQTIEEKDLLSIRDGVMHSTQEILHEKIEIETIVRCYLASMIRSFQVHEDEENSQLFIELFKDLENLPQKNACDELTTEDILNYAKPCFKPGQYVRHIRYGYRGIIVDVNQDCMATDNWYYGNQTQPTRYQPWYHVLVGGSDQVTYVAQSNLEEELLNVKMTHPLLSYFFKKTKEGRYVRNNNPWPETDI